MKKAIGIDLFSGAGGLSLGAELAGISVLYAVELDRDAAQTYKLNHPKTTIINQNIRDVSIIIREKDIPIVLFGGPPCQGFSTSNQRTRSKTNPQNWLFQEMMRIAKEIEPEWIVIENVKGIKETEKGFFFDSIKQSLDELGYNHEAIVLRASDFGVPQTRTRLFIVGTKGKELPRIMPPQCPIVTVREAIEDLPDLENGARQDNMKYKKKARSQYAIDLRGSQRECSGNLVSRNSDIVIRRYAFIPPGGNWRDIPISLMDNYTNRSLCHTGIYRRIDPDKPSVTLGNFRKSMLIHPWQDRGLSIREAARIQSFPDSYLFCGSIGSQQQQVGNAVPPILAKYVFTEIMCLL